MHLRGRVLTEEPIQDGGLPLHLRASPPGHMPRRGTLRLTITSIVIALLLLLLVLPSTAWAQPSTSGPSIVLEGRAKEEVAELRQKAARVQSDIDQLDLEVELMAEEYNGLSVKLEALNTELAKLRRELDLARTNHDYRTGQVEERLRQAYKTGDEGLLEVVLAADGFTDLVRRFVLFYHIAERDQNLAAGFGRTATEMDALQGDMEVKKVESMAIQERLIHKRAEIERRLSHRAEMLDGIDEKIAQVIEEERERQEEERRRREAELRARLAAQRAAQRAARNAAWTGPMPDSPAEVLNQVIETSVAYLGVPYQWGGKRPSTGLDCSGFTKWVYEQHGVVLAHWSRHQSQMGAPVRLEDIRKGDLVAFGAPVHHVGIYVGDGKFIHAPRTGTVIRIDGLSSRDDLSAIRRFPLVAREGAAAQG